MDPAATINIGAEIVFSLCLSRKRNVFEVTTGCGDFSCDGLFPLPVEEKTISRLPQKTMGVLGGSARDALFPLPVEEKAVSGLPGLGGCPRP